MVGKHCESGDIVVRDCWLPADLARRFAMAMSKGRFYNSEIRGRFACTALDAELAEVA